MYGNILKTFPVTTTRHAHRDIKKVLLENVPSRYSQNQLPPAIITVLKDVYRSGETHANRRR